MGISDLEHYLQDKHLNLCSVGQVKLLDGRFGCRVPHDRNLHLAEGIRGETGLTSCLSGRRKAFAGRKLAG